MEKYKIAIVGSGPGGLSAAAHAAELGVNHILLESTSTYSNTIQRYQKGKPVMAEPSYLPLRSPVAFSAGKREQILGTWGQCLESLKVNVLYNSEVKSIEGHKGDFTLTTTNGKSIAAEYVILAIGLQGNPRRIDVPGDDLPFIQYTLDDPDEYKGERIIVIGAGDAAIENAIALANKNKVYVVNRKDEFARAKQGNLDLILNAISSGKITCYYNATSTRVDALENGDTKGILHLSTPEGEIPVACDRIIARLGAIPPRAFVESCGLKFPSEDRNALPELNEKYESSVPGLYVIGALGGYPLIKQALNQGFEVVEYILGNTIKPADYDLLVQRLGNLPYQMDVEQCLTLFRTRIPMFKQINPLLFRELILESKTSLYAEGEHIYKIGDYSNSFFTVVDGEVEILFEGSAASGYSVVFGQFFGEQSLLSGRRRSNTAIARSDVIVVETPRRTMLKLIASVDSVRQGIDEVFIARALQESFLPNESIDKLKDVARLAELRSYKLGEVLYRQGDTGSSIHLVRKGSLSVSRDVGDKQSILSHVYSGSYIGEVSLMNVEKRTETVTAAVATETVTLSREAFIKLIKINPELLKKIQSNLKSRAITDTLLESNPQQGKVIQFLMHQGMGEATDALIINESLCVGCDNCERACAETHKGISRLNRRAGPTFNNIHIPTVCRHCENPHCMKDCPPNAIQRSGTGEVYIADTCIGCGNCVSNCPYGVIRLEYPKVKKPGLLSWLLLGAGPGPGDTAKAVTGADAVKKAVKCDLCQSLKGGPACVRACPTGAAKRIKADQFSQIL